MMSLFCAVFFSVGDGSACSDGHSERRRMPVNEFVFRLFSPWFPRLLTSRRATPNIIASQSKGNQKKSGVSEGKGRAELSVGSVRS